MTSESVSGSTLIPVGISSCLLGEKVRYDGGHKGHSYITQTLGNYFEFRAFCPEVSIGLGIPRKPMRLWRNRGNRSSIHCVDAGDISLDYTTALQDCGDEQKSWQQLLCGYNFKERLA